MSFAKRALTRGLIELAALARPRDPEPGLRVLLYHAVGTKLDFGHGLSVNPVLFRQHMALLRWDESFKIVPLDGAALDGGQPRVAVTFDDGYKDNLTAAAPALEEFGIPFTVFVVPAYVKSGNPYYLTLAELKRLAEVPGCTIGSHGMNHYHLAALEAPQALAELKDSRAWLQDHLGRPVDTVAYPFGSANRRVMAAAAEAGYRVGACSRTGVNGPRRPPLMLCRTEILAQDDARAFQHKLRGAWDWHRFRHKDPAESE